MLWPRKWDSWPTRQCPGDARLKGRAVFDPMNLPAPEAHPALPTAFPAVRTVFLSVLIITTNIFYPLTFLRASLPRTKFTHAGRSLVRLCSRFSPASRQCHPARGTRQGSSSTRGVSRWDRWEAAPRTTGWITAASGPDCALRCVGLFFCSFM